MTKRGRLILSRKKGQRIVIGGDEAREDITIEVVETHRSSCKLAIEAPAGTIIYRVEVKSRGPEAHEGREKEDGGES